MKEFEKWREQDSKGAGIWTTAAYKKGWKAALECVQNIACKGGILQNDFVIRKWIREELEE